ncbi:hypothetical protein P8452_66307 [Trifolium repens]|nr:hypothetical protein P8452_66307 [Trifolium repens]
MYPIFPFPFHIDDRNFYGILGSIFRRKMTKTGPNTKKNLQNPRKASGQSQECKKTRKSPKYEENEHFIVAIWLPSCHDGSCLLAKKTEEINLENICSSQHDGTHRSTMTLLGDQADEMHKISYKIELNLPIVLRWTYRSTMAC